MPQKKKLQAKARTAKASAPVSKSAAKVAPVKKAHTPAQPQKHAKKAPVKPAVKPAVAAKPVAAKKVEKVEPPAKAAKPVAKPASASAPKVAAKAQAPSAVKPVVKPEQALRPSAQPIFVRPGQAAPAAARAMPASALVKSAGQKLSGPMVPATPKAIAEKAAAARQAMTSQAVQGAAAAPGAPKKPVNQRHGFKTNEFIVYPAHGVGRIVGIEEQEIAGMALELFVITFDKDKLTLRVPTSKLQSVGMRKLAEDVTVKKALETLKGRARVKRTMWSRRAQEYVAKINSGDLVSIAEVVRDLYRSEAQPEQSYSERQLYEDALDRMAREIAAVEKLDERGAVQRITDILVKSAKGRRIGEGEAVDAEVKAA